jgi:MinD-like ATPase involved in chromosome partitioning or flagellar assembly
VGINRSDVDAIFGRTPNVFVPSDREIPRATTDGQPIVLAAPRSEAARAFHELADLYIQEELGGEVSVASSNGNANGRPKRRLRALAGARRS